MSFQIQTVEIPVRPKRQNNSSSPREHKYPFRQMEVTQNNFFHIPYALEEENKDKMKNRIRSAVTNFIKKNKEYKFKVLSDIVNPTTQEKGIGVWRVEKTDAPENSELDENN